MHVAACNVSGLIIARLLLGYVIFMCDRRGVGEESYTIKRRNSYLQPHLNIKVFSRLLVHLSRVDFNLDLHSDLGTSLYV